MFKALTVAFALLIVAALGHDGYVAYIHPELGQLPESFRLSDLGWLWTTYSPDTYKSTRDAMGTDAFGTWIDPILSQKTVLIAAIPLVILLIVKGILKVIERTRSAGVGKVTTLPPKGQSRYRYRRK